MRKRTQERGGGGSPGCEEEDTGGGGGHWCDDLAVRKRTRDGGRGCRCS